MKKIFLTIIILITSMTNMIGQEEGSDEETTYNDKIVFGFKAGGNLSNVYDSKGEEFKADAKLGWVAGAFVAIPIGEVMGIQPEVLFSQKGFHGEGTILGGNYDFKRTTNYIDIPVFFAIKPVPEVTILAGPQFSYLLSQVDAFKTASTTIQQQQEFENDNLRKNTMSFITGLDVNLDHFIVGARVAWDVLNNNGNGTSDTPRYKNVWYQATMGYRF